MAGTSPTCASRGALGAHAKLVAQLGDEQAVCRVNVAERDDGVPELRIEYSDEDPIAFRAYFDPPDPGPDGSQTLKILVRHAAVKRILGDDLSRQDSVEWLTLLPEIVCDTMVRRLMQRKHPISEEIDAQTLYRDHADWHLRLLPKVQRLVLALAGADRVAERDGNDEGLTGVTPEFSLPLSIPRAVARRQPPRDEPPAQLRLGGLASSDGREVAPHVRLE